ncbi:MAG TPA: quinone oxidoreductase [Amphiplicatus sp.]|nr:quinone oxidoreductase [Amphiplicatus sp.]
MGKAVFIDSTGGPEGFRVGERADPSPGPGEIAVANSASGVNFIDIYQRRGLYPVSLPAILGQEGAGKVIAVGEGVAAFRPGDRVAYLSGGGSYASVTLAPAVMAAKIPGGVSDDIAASVFLKGLTAEMLVRDVFPLNDGHTALVYAAAGGVGSILVQWASKLGAEVIAVVGDEAKAAAARSYGANYTINRKETHSIASEVRRITGGRGVDVAYDSVGAATFEASLDSLAMRGMMVSYGNASGPVPPFSPLELSRRGSLFLTRPTLFHYATPERLPSMAADLFEMIASGAIKIPAPTVYPLEKTADAHEFLESGASSGAIILKP